MATRREFLAAAAAGALGGARAEEKEKEKPKETSPGSGPGAYGLRFETPVTVWDEALPLGNGMLGALVWGNGAPVKISLDRADLWDLRPVPEFHSKEYSFAQMKRWHEEGRTADLIRLYEAPYNRPAPTKIPAGRIELTIPGSPKFLETSLSLESAEASMKFKGDAELRAFVHAAEPIGMIRFAGGRDPEVKLVAPPFSGKVAHAAAGGIEAGDLTQLGYPPPAERSGQNWRAYTQKGAEGLRFTVYAAWRKSEGLWQLTWTIASSFEGGDPFERARGRVDAALGEGYAGRAEMHRQWWKRYWSRSAIHVPNRTIDRQWHLEQYKFGAAARLGAPPISLQSVWTADNGGLPPWKGDFHHDLNTQLSYWPCYGANHLEEGLGYLEWLWKTRAVGREWTERFFKLPGLNMPMTTDLNGNQIGGWRQYTHSATTAAWLAHHFYLHWKHSGDRQFLRERAYPYLREASVFLEAFTAKRDAAGKRTFPLSASPEINDNRPEAWFAKPTNYDVALTRWLFGATADLATELSESGDARRWRKAEAELPALSLGAKGELLVAPGYPLKESHRHFSHLMAIHPLGLIDASDGPEARRTVDASLAELDRLGSGEWCGYSFAWLACLAARAGNGAKAEKALEIFSTAFTLRNSFHCNGDQSGKGYSKMKYRPFTLEGNFAAAQGVQEMLLQNRHGRITVFPAVPAGWKDVSFRSLRTEGGFLVSADRRGGKVVHIQVIGERGGRCHFVSPTGGKDIVVDLHPGQDRVVL